MLILKNTQLNITMEMDDQSMKNFYGGEILKVGPSHEPKKVIHRFPENYAIHYLCPRSLRVLPVNPRRSNLEVEFKAEVIGDNLEITRTDKRSGWRMDLEIIIISRT